MANSNFSVIVPAFNEKNINETIVKLLNQNLNGFSLDKIIVVALGYDENYKFHQDKKVQLIREYTRKGKAHSINLGLRKIKSPLVVVESGDTIPKRNTIKNLLAPFQNPEVGMTTGRPIPLNNENEMSGFLVHFIWCLYHCLLLKNPKAGEIIAFRRLFKKIPRKVSADESYIEYFCKKNSYNLVYVPTAVVSNIGPFTVRDFIKQRKRIFNGHLHISRKYKYKVSSMNFIHIIDAFIHYLEIKSIKTHKEFFYIIAAIFIEILSRFLAVIDFYVLNKVDYKWELVKR